MAPVQAGRKQTHVLIALRCGRKVTERHRPRRVVPTVAAVDRGRQQQRPRIVFEGEATLDLVAVAGGVGIRRERTVLIAHPHTQPPHRPQC